MAVIFINRFFYPDLSATSQLLTDLAFGLAKEGWSVVVITSRLRYDSRDELPPAREITHGVDVHRVWSTRDGRANLVRRAIEYLTFHLSVACRLWRLARAGDLVVSLTDPPLLSLTTTTICRLRGALALNWLQDLFPEVAEAMIKSATSMPLFRVLRRLRDLSLRASAMNVVIGERMARRLLSSGIAAEKVRLIPNWSDGAVVRPIVPGDNALRESLKCGNAFVVSYSGNLGRVHDVETMLDAMTILTAGEMTRTRSANGGRAIIWLFIGSGALMPRLKAEVARRALTGIVIMPYQAREMLAQSLSIGDLHLLSLRPEFEGLVVPSKVYGIAAAGRPMVLIGDRDGEVGRLIARHGCGVAVPVGDGVGLARAILDLKDRPSLCHDMGRAARRAFEAEYDKELAVRRWSALLATMRGERRRAPRAVPLGQQP